jgi:hypothetical protein
MTTSHILLLDIVFRLGGCAVVIFTEAGEFCIGAKNVLLFDGLRCQVAGFTIQIYD